MNIYIYIYLHLIEYNHSDVDRIWDVQRYSHFSEVSFDICILFLLEDDSIISRIMKHDCLWYIKVIYAIFRQTHLFRRCLGQRHLFFLLFFCCSICKCPICFMEWYMSIKASPQKATGTRFISENT